MGCGGICRDMQLPSRTEGIPSWAEGNPNVYPSVKSRSFNGLRPTPAGGLHRDILRSSQGPFVGGIVSRKRPPTVAADHRAGQFVLHSRSDRSTAYDLSKEISHKCEFGVPTDMGLLPVCGHPIAPRANGVALLWGRSLARSSPAPTVGEGGSGTGIACNQD
jgi:hypothetical protein